MARDRLWGLGREGARRPRCGFNRLKTIMSLQLKVRLRHIGLYPMNTRDFDKGGFRGLYTFQRGQFGDKMWYSTGGLRGF